MKCVVTGGAGFIGSHLCERLLVEGHSVLCVDNLGSGKKWNVKRLMREEGFRFLKHDIRVPFNTEVEWIFDLASRASPVDFERFPVEIAMTNSLGTFNMLELARKRGARLVFASTSEVYGDPEEHPQKESYWGHVNPNGVRSCYDESKRFAEALIFSHKRKLGTDAGVVRIFNTYGPRMRKDDGRVVPNFITQALTGRPLSVYGDGKQTRSFCYVDDLVDGLMRMMGSEETGPVNLGSPVEFGILEVAKVVQKLAGTGSKIVFGPLPKDDPVRRRPDITKAKRVLKWQPKVSLEDGLKRTMAWFREN